MTIPHIYFEIPAARPVAFNYHGHLVELLFTVELDGGELRHSLGVICDSEPINSAYDNDSFCDAVVDLDFNSDEFREALEQVLDDHITIKEAA